MQLQEAPEINRHHQWTLPFLDPYNYMQPLHFNCNFKKHPDTINKLSPPSLFDPICSHHTSAATSRSTQNEHHQWILPSLYLDPMQPLITLQPKLQESTWIETDTINEPSPHLNPHSHVDRSCRQPQLKQKDIRYLQIDRETAHCSPKVAKYANCPLIAQWLTRLN